MGLHQLSCVNQHIDVNSTTDEILRLDMFVDLDVAIAINDLQRDKQTHGFQSVLQSIDYF